MRIEVDRDMCIGYANCVRVAEGVFELDEEGLSTVRDPGARDVVAVRSAERVCPTGAITVAYDEK